MKKNLIFAAGTVFLALTLSGCGKTEVPQGSTEKSGKAETVTPENTKSVDNTDKTSIKSCAKEKVNLPNYDDPAQRLTNCFVEYPGEPSREDKSYYIVEDICGQFTKEFMENMYSAKLDRLEPPQVSGLNNCTYYFNDKAYIILNLEYLAIENQKTGNEFAGYTVAKNDKIPMENLVATQEDGVINAIYLVLNPNKFISMRPSSKGAIENEKFISLAANIASEIKNYK